MKAERTNLPSSLSRLAFNPPPLLGWNKASFTMSLLNLPPELLCIIVDLILPDDIVNFASCCGVFLKLARARLKEHRQLLKYRYIRLNWMFSSPAPVMQILIDIMSNPRIPFYAKCLDIAYLGESWDGVMANERSRHKAMALQTQQHRLRPLIEGCPYVQEDEYDTWVEATESGNEDPLAFILISLLPHLRLIRYNSNSLATAQSLTKGISRIRLATELNRKPEALNALEHLLVDDTGVSEATALEPFSSLTALPTVRYISVASEALAYQYHDQHKSLQCYSRRRPDIGYLCGASAVPKPRETASLHFRDWVIHPNHLRLILKGIGPLEAFTQSNHLRGAGPWWDPYATTMILIEHTPYTLKKLQISSSLFQPDLYIRSLKRLICLQHLQVDTTLFIRKNENDEVKTRTLVSMLPPSIETVEFSSEWKQFHVASILDGLSTTRLPRLKRIAFQHEHPREIISSFRHQLRRGYSANYEMHEYVRLGLENAGYKEPKGPIIITPPDIDDNCLLDQPNHYPPPLVFPFSQPSPLNESNCLMVGVHYLRRRHHGLSEGSFTYYQIRLEA